MMLSDFSKSLKEKLDNVPLGRPFVCEGNPKECKVFIVGFNAATEMKADFWQFWKEDEGFNKRDWLEAYIKERTQNPIQNSKRKRNRLSNTRQRIEWISETLQPHKCLETNLYAKATATAKDLAKEDQKTVIFEFLMEEIKPQIVLLHGKKVREEFEKKYRVSLNPGQINHYKILNQSLKIYPVSHLSREWSQVASKSLGDELKNELESII